MTHLPHGRAVVRNSGKFAAALGVVAMLGACTPTGDFMFGSRDAASAAPAPIGATRLMERDIEAPEVFEVTDMGLWDGRPSLGGVWVAHPDATDPERVIIRNEETGSFVIGALFRRERNNPGPVIQVSSDAAAALDILAGAPARMHIVALRREEVPQETSAPEDAPLADADAAPVAAPSASAPIAASALPSADATPLTAPAEIEAAPTGAVADAARPARTFFRPAAPAAPAAAAPLPRNMSADDVVSGITRAAFSADDLGGPRPVSAIADTAAAAIAETEVAARAPAPVAAAPTPAPAPVATPLPARAPAAGSLDRPYVQIGIFSVQENAASTGQALRSAGLVPTIYDQTSNGRQFWRVVVGPAPSASDRAAILETVRGLGFGDAYFVAR